MEKKYVIAEIKEEKPFKLGAFGDVWIVTEYKNIIDQTEWKRRVSAIMALTNTPDLDNPDKAMKILMGEGEK